MSKISKILFVLGFVAAVIGFVGYLLGPSRYPGDPNLGHLIVAKFDSIIYLLMAIFLAVIAKHFENHGK
ncbi:MAG: hypothetical protein AAB617_02960 [Patescibacteria group bacterium]